MSENSCPECGAALPVEAINIAEGVALCRGCGRLSSLSDVMYRLRSVVECLRNPPRGCSVTDSAQDVVLVASLQSVGRFWGTLCFALFFNAMTAIFVLTAIGGLYENLVGPLPEWCPAPDMDGRPMTLRSSLVLCIVSILFIVFGGLLVGLALVFGIGKIDVVLGASNAVVRTGVGYLTWGRHFDPRETREVSIVRTTGDDVRPGQQVVIKADRTVKLGSLLNDDRREWLHAMLRELLVNPDPARRSELLALAGRRRERS